jgi:hypothetical protein
MEIVGASSVPVPKVAVAGFTILENLEFNNTQMQ